MEEFPEIYTGNGIDRDLAATTNDRLKKTVLELRSLKGSVDSLEKTILVLDAENGALQSRLYWLMVVGVVIAALQLIGVISPFIKK